jgi:photosystem II stability/assembly factor-like uncharacterized protein
MRPEAALAVFFLIGSSAAAQWASQPSGTNAKLRGLCAVSEQVAWASGTGGTCLRTADGGRTWRALTVPDAGGLDFRDVHAFDADNAFLLSIGEGEKSRILRTADGGVTWSTAHVNRDPKGFLDAIAFFDRDHGLALGDPVGGRFMVLTTADGGKTWDAVPPGGIPEALPGEGAFAASGTCLLAGSDGRAWFATGGGRVARIFRSDDRGRTWTVHETPLAAGKPSSGVFSLSFRDGENGVAVGGDYKEPGRAADVVALTSDGGKTWTRPAGPLPGGYRSAVCHVPGTQGRTLVAVGPTGSDVSHDGGESWRPLETTGFNAVQFAGPTAGWAVGDDGLVARFTPSPSRSPQPSPP